LFALFNIVTIIELRIKNLMNSKSSSTSKNQADNVIDVELADES